MSELIQIIVDTVKSLTTGLVKTIQGMFSNLLYVDPEATSPVISEFAKYAFLFIGISIAMSLVFFVIRLVKR